jgi:uncharacterized membrane protein
LFASVIGTPISWYSPARSRRWRVRSQKSLQAPVSFRRQRASYLRRSRTAHIDTMLSWPYAHLLITHFPVVLSISALGATILALLLGRRGVWLTAMAALTTAGLFVYPVHFTGDKANRVLNDPWYVQQGVIGAHDDAARIAMWVILVAGAFAAYSWWKSFKRPDQPIPWWMRAGVVVGALGAVGTVTYTAYLGGKIIHEAPVLQLKQPPVGVPPALDITATPAAAPEFARSSPISSAPHGGTRGR